MEAGFVWTTYAWRLAVTLLFVGLNGFFVAAEFALVKVRATQLEAAAAAGRSGAALARRQHRQLERYLSACQLGITLSSLILGWLAEPAIAELLIAGMSAAGIEGAVTDPILHGVALAIALAIVTVLHMVLGEQAPKIWAIRRPDTTASIAALPLAAFERFFRPFIWLIDTLSKGLLRAIGLEETDGHGTHSIDEIRSILVSSAEQGHISPRQLELAENVFGIMQLEARHILVPRVDTVVLDLDRPAEENLRVIRESGHSRHPLCRGGLDNVVGIVHSKDVLRALLENPGGPVPDLEALARKALIVPDTMPVARLIGRLQEEGHLAVVIDERGTAVGLVFLEDALEEIVGPIRDEFDVHAEERDAEVIEREPGRAWEISGALPLPDAIALLDLPELGAEADTLGGLVVSLLGRLPRVGDAVRVGAYEVSVLAVDHRRRVERVRVERTDSGAESGPPPAETGG